MKLKNTQTLARYHFERFRERIVIKLAFWMPARLCLWCFIRVHASMPNGPGSDYVEAYHAFVDKHKLKGC